MKYTLYNRRHGESWWLAAVLRWSAWARCAAIVCVERAGPAGHAETAGSRRGAVRIAGQDSGLAKNLQKKENEVTYFFSVG